MSDFIRSSAAELAARLADRSISSVEVTQAHLDRIAAVDGDVHAFLHVSEHALEVAGEIDARRAAGEELGELAGVPLAIKDVLVTTDMPSTSGSKILEGFMSPYDATVVARARAAGLVPLGKTNMDEFAMGSSTEHSAYGPTRNPWDLDRIPGGSGGGSAAAVAAFEAPLALGSDTGGSIRQPAHVTGTVGVKPTYGGVSRYGSIALASSLDQVGPVSRTVLDSALLHDVIGGHDPHDSTSLADQWPSFAAAAREGARGDVLRGLKVGVIRELADVGFQPGVSASFRASLAAMEAQGAEIVEISAPHFEYGVAAYYLILPAEASSNLAKFDSVRFDFASTCPAAPSRTSCRRPAKPASATRSSAASSWAPTPCRPATTTPTTAALRRCGRSSSAISTKLSRRSMSSRLRPHPRPRSVSATRSTIRCRCT